MSPSTCPRPVQGYKGCQIAPEQLTISGRSVSTFKGCTTLLRAMGLVSLSSFFSNFFERGLLYALLVFPKGGVASAASISVSSKLMARGCVLFWLEVLGEG